MADLVASRYELVRILGQGAMGVVWLAEDTLLGRPIALKELRPSPGVNVAEATERFLVEARAAARLSHPNIVGVYDVLTEGDRVLIAMELVEGPTLEEVVRRSGAQPAEVVRAIVAQVAQALAMAHGAGIVHRDLKPDNIFWTPDGRAVVADFGLARIGAGQGTVEGTIMGTPGYMAPEQVRGASSGPQADIFAWGAVAYALAAGASPFGEASVTDPIALAYRIVHEDPPPLVLPGDPALAALVMTCMAKDPAARPGDGTELLRGLVGAGRQSTAARRVPADFNLDRSLADSSDPLNVPTTPVVPQHPQAGRRGPWPIVVAVATAATIGGAVGVAFTGHIGSRESAGTQQVATETTAISTTLAPTVPTTVRSTTSTTAEPAAPVLVQKFYASGYSFSDAVILAAIYKLPEPYDGKVMGGRLVHTSRPGEIDAVINNEMSSFTSSARRAYSSGGYNYSDAEKVAAYWRLKSPWVGKLYIGLYVLKGSDQSTFSGLGLSVK